MSTREGWMFRLKASRNIVRHLSVQALPSARFVVEACDLFNIIARSAKRLASHFHGMSGAFSLRVLPVSPTLEKSLVSLKRGIHVQAWQLGAKYGQIVDSDMPSHVEETSLDVCRCGPGRMLTLSGTASTHLLRHLAPRRRQGAVCRPTCLQLRTG